MHTAKNLPSVASINRISTVYKNQFIKLYQEAKSTSSKQDQEVTGSSADDIRLFVYKPEKWINYIDSARINLNYKKVEQLFT